MSVLSVTALNQFYGGSHTLWDVSLDVAAGSRTCLMGRNGMGKTTLLKCIMGLLPAASGAIVFDGSDLRAQPPEARARRGIGYVPQGREIFPQLTVEENLQVGAGIRVRQILRRRHGSDRHGDRAFLRPDGEAVRIKER